MPDAARHQARDGCPRCRGSLLRVHRRLQDLPAGTDEGWRRYRCSVATCAWEGLLQRRDHSASRWSVLVESWPRLALLGLAGLTALGAVAAVYQLVSAEASVLVGPHVLQRGQHHDGDWLPADHPLLARVQQRPASAPDASAVMAQPPPRATDPKPPQPVVVAAALAVTVAAAMSPDADALVLSLPATTLSAGVKPKPPAPAPTSLAALHLRRHCAWAQPGRSPYRGTVEQALGLAQLPPEVVRQVADAIDAGRVTEQLRITNVSIRADDSGREFDPANVAMTYGHTLCLDTRVNFQPGHMERAALYEATDNDGKVHAVMVPYVCGNVSVLSARGERRPLTTDAAQAEQTGDRQLPAALRYPGPDAMLLGEDDSRALRSPGTLGLALMALVSLLLRRRR